MSKKKTIAVLLIAMFSLLCVSRCYAGGWSGNENLPTGSSSNGWGQSGGNHNVFWFHYNYIGGNAWAGKSINIVTQWNSTTYPEISGECASTGVGFWVLSLATDGQSKYDNGFYRNETGLNGSWRDPKTVNGVKNYYKNKKCEGCKSYKVDTPYGGITEFWGKAYAPYHTLSLNNATGNQSANYSLNGATLAGQILYANDNAVYENDRIAGSFSEIAKAYRLYTRRDNTVADLGDNVSDNEVANTMSSNKTYAFCSYPDEVNADLESQTKITATANDTSEGSRDKTSGWNDVNAVNNDILVVHSSSSITFGSQYKAKRNKSDFASNAVENAVTSTLSTNPSHDRLPSTGKFNLPQFSKGVSEVGFQNGQSITVNVSTLAIGKVYTFCASHSQPGKITVSSNNVSTSGTSQSKACVKVKYDPITAEVDSDSVAIVNKVAYYSSHADGRADVIKQYNIDVNAGPNNNIEWAHNIGYRKLSGKAPDGVWTKTRNIYGGGDLAHGLQIDEYTEPSTNSKIGYKWDRYITYNTLDRYPSASSAHSSNVSNNVGAFPGESYVMSQYLTHPDKVNAGKAAEPAAGYKEETSGVEISLNANNIECGLNDDIKFSIGANDANDYRWLSIINDNNIKKTVGDNTLQNDVFWLKPENQIKITQTACFGSQIALDASNKGSDRWTKNPWKKITDYSNNKLFELTGELTDSSLFKNATGASKTESQVGTSLNEGSHAGASLAASEIGISDFSKESNPSIRVENGYKIETTSDTAVIGNLGKSLKTSFSKPNDKFESVSITTKIPYNYYMSLDLASDGSNGYLTSESTQFTLNIKNEGRINVQVCNDTLNIECNKYVDVQECNNNLEDCNKYKYSTMSKKTTAGMLVFTISSEFKADDLLGKDSFSYNGNIFDSANELLLKNRMVEAVKNHLPYGDSIQVIDSSHLKDITNKEIDDKTAVSERSITADNLNLNDLAVGTKVCAVAAVYPSDSHDTGNGDPINDPVQYAAFKTTGTKTGLKVSCRTVAKRQNMSVEGNGVVTTQTISSSSTTYGRKIFRSWSEYQIISGGSNASSGAVTAYALNNTAAKTENGAAALSDSSVESSKYLYPQTLGNYSLAIIGDKKSDPNSVDESQANWRYSETLIKNIVDTYGTRNDGCTVGELPTSKNYLRCIGGGNLSSVNPGEMDTLVVRSTGTLTINNDSHLDDLSQWGNPKQLIIIAPSILIDGNVTKVNAWLIVDGGELNTCSINGIGATPGDENTLDNCNNPLIINGPVIVRSTLNTALKMPRTFGGGSKVNEKGEFVKDPETLVQRAEIFNYDPSVVEWAYRESQKNPHLETTYTETLAPRL